MEGRWAQGSIYALENMVYQIVEETIWEVTSC